MLLGVLDPVPPDIGGYESEQHLVQERRTGERGAELFEVPARSFHSVRRTSLVAITSISCSRCRSSSLARAGKRFFEVPASDSKRAIALV